MNFHRSKVKVKYLPLPFPTIVYETGSLIEPEGHILRKNSQLASPGNLFFSVPRARITLLHNARPLDCGLRLSCLHDKQFID